MNRPVPLFTLVFLMLVVLIGALTSFSQPTASTPGDVGTLPNQIEPVPAGPIPKTIQVPAASETNLTQAVEPSAQPPEPASPTLEITSQPPETIPAPGEALPQPVATFPPVEDPEFSYPVSPIAPIASIGAIEAIGPIDLEGPEVSTYPDSLGSLTFNPDIVPPEIPPEEIGSGALEFSEPGTFSASPGSGTSQAGLSQKPKPDPKMKKFFPALEGVLIVGAKIKPGPQAAGDEKKPETVEGRILIEEHPVKRRRFYRRYCLQTEEGKRFPLSSNLQFLTEIKQEGVLDAKVKLTGQWIESPFGEGLKFFACNKIQILDNASASRIASAPVLATPTAKLFPWERWRRRR